MKFINNATSTNIAITVRLAGEKYHRTFVVMKSGIRKSVSITVFSSATKSEIPLSNISVPTVRTIALILKYAMKYP